MTNPQNDQTHSNSSTATNDVGSNLSPPDRFVLTLPTRGRLPTKVTPDIDFTDELAVQCDKLVAKKIHLIITNTNDCK